MLEFTNGDLCQIFCKDSQFYSKEMSGDFKLINSYFNGNFLKNNDIKLVNSSITFSID